MLARDRQRRDIQYGSGTEDPDSIAGLWIDHAQAGEPPKGRKRQAEVALPKTRAAKCSRGTPSAGPQVYTGMQMTRECGGGVVRKGGIVYKGQITEGGCLSE